MIYADFIKNIVSSYGVRS